MTVGELIAVLKKFSPEAPVRVGVTWPDRVIETHERLWVGEYEEGPVINAAMDLRGVNVFVGCVLHQQIADRPPQSTPLGHYENAEMAARVRDFYIVHKGLDEPLNFPEFDYDNWIPPREISGEYNPRIAEILRVKLLKD